DSRPFVTEDGAGPGELLQHHVQIGAADPALRDLHEDLAGTGLGPRYVLDFDPALADVDGGWHQLGRHGTTLSAFSGRCRKERGAIVGTLHHVWYVSYRS